MHNDESGAATPTLERVAGGVGSARTVVPRGHVDFSGPISTREISSGAASASRTPLTRRVIGSEAPPLAMASSGVSVAEREKRAVGLALRLHFLRQERGDSTTS